MLRGFLGETQVVLSLGRYNEDVREFLMFFTKDGAIVMVMPLKGAQWHRDIIPALKRVARHYGVKEWQVDGLNDMILSRDRWEYDIKSRDFIQTACRLHKGKG